MNLEQAHKILEENKQTYNEIADEFDKTRNKYDFLMDELKKYVKGNERVLDLGCGNGRLYKIFENRNVDYTGVDFSENLIQKDIKKYGNHFKTADILSLPFPGENFDSVWAIAVLHHIPTAELRKRVLSEIKRVLGPKGKVIATCWKIKSFFRKDIFIPFHGKRRYYHVFSKREIGGLFEKAGFKIEELKILKNNILVVATPRLHSG